MGKNGENENENGWIPDRILGYHFSVGNSRFFPLSSRMENTKRLELSWVSFIASSVHAWINYKTRWD
jgi:hypothetical protein